MKSFEDYLKEYGDRRSPSSGSEEIGMARSTPEGKVEKTAGTVAYQHRKFIQKSGSKLDSHETDDATDVHTIRHTTKSGKKVTTVIKPHPDNAKHSIVTVKK